MSDPQTLFLGEGQTWVFLLECALRTAIMFLAVLILFKITGKKEVRQFSVLELIVVIGLGSALGDPMIYVDSPILPSVVAMFIVLLCYWLVNKWASRSRTMEKLIEGSVVQVLCNGLVNIEALKKEGMTPHEFYGELRVQHVEHLGQVKSAYIEIDGEVSVFFQPDDAVQYGLPIAPELIRSRIIPVRGPVACAGCGSVHGNLQSLECTRCGTDHWIEASNAKRQS